MTLPGGEAPVSPGQLIVVNGTSSAGKTTTCQALQNLLEAPYLLLGYDHLWVTMPQRYFPFQPSERDGVWYELTPDDPSRASGVGFGAVGRQVVSGVHHAVAALVASGINVIVDVLFVAPDWYEEAMRLWRPFAPLLVALKPPVEVSERWEAERRDTQAGRPTGLARAAYEVVYAHAPFDLELDPSLGTPEDCARQVMARLN